MACVGHELTGPLMALYTHVRLAQRRNDLSALDAAIACLDRLSEITSTLQAAGRIDDLDDVTAGGGGSATLAVLAAGAIAKLDRRDVTIITAGEPGPVAASAGALIVGAAVRAVARTAPDQLALQLAISGTPALAQLRIDTAGAPAERCWRTIEPLVSGRLGLDLWLAAVATAEAGGELRMADVDGTIVLELELPAYAAEAG